MEVIGYVDEPCENCGRVRVEKWDFGSGKFKHICEKCRWCVEEQGYVDVDAILDEAFESSCEHFRFGGKN